MRYYIDYGNLRTDWHTIESDTTGQGIVDMISEAQEERYSIAFHDPETGVRFGYHSLTSRWFYNQPNSKGEPGLCQYHSCLEPYHRIRSYIDNA